MRVESERRLFTREDFYRMYEAGILDGEESVELLDGEIVKMTNPGKRHAACTNRVNRVLTITFGERAVVSIQNPFVLDLYNEPKPDVVVAKPSDDFYASEELAAPHAWIVIEISDSSLFKDRNRKLPHYARLGIPEYWIVDLKNDLLLVFRDPANASYGSCQSLRRGDSFSPLAFPDIVFKPEQFLG